MGLQDPPSNDDEPSGLGLDAVRILAETTRAFAAAPADAALAGVIAHGLGRAVTARCTVHLGADEPDLPPAGDTCLRLPLHAAGERYGELVLVRPADRLAFTAAEQALAAILAVHAALALAHARRCAELAVTRADAAVAQETARNRLSRFARLSEAGILGIFVATSRRRVVEVNETFARMLGFTREEIVAEDFDWTERTPPEWRAADTAVVATLQTDGFVPVREKEYFHKSGERIAVLAGSAVVEADGFEVITFILDITARKRAEAETRQTREESAMAARLAAIVDSSDDAILGFGLDGKVTSWNHGARVMFGYTEDEVVGTAAGIAIIAPPDRASLMPEVRSAVLRGQVVRLDTACRHKDGHLIDVALTVSPIFDAARAVAGASTLFHDITDRRRVTLALASARDEALAASRELETFSYSVAHDLRAPLRAISGFAKVLGDEYGAQLDHDGRDCLDEVRGGAQKMAALIDALLSLSRVTRSELRRERVDLAALVRASAAELAGAEPGRAVTVITPPTAIYAWLDSRLARVLVDNLVGNAWKFTRDAAAARIELGTHADGGSIFVADNGAGFDMAHAAKLFSPFHRLHTVHEFPGTGIGLATVQRILQRHGGRIWAVGTVGQGATFSFTLPTDTTEGTR